VIAYFERLNQEARAALAIPTSPAPALTRDPYSIEGFARLYFAEYLQNDLSQFHRDYIADLARISSGRGARLNRMAPRGAAKTAWLTIETAYNVCYGLEPYTVFIKNTAGQAKKDMEPLRDAFRPGGPLARDYGLRAVASTSTALEMSNRTRVEAYGMDQQIRGIKYGSHRPSRINVDDPQGSEDIISPVYRERASERLRKEILPSGGPETNILVVGTALHKEAIVCELAASAVWNTRLYRAVEAFPTRMDLWHAYRDILLDSARAESEKAADAFYRDRAADMDAGAAVFWPARFPLLAMMKLFFTTSIGAWNTEFQNLPRNEDQLEWPPEYFDWEGFWYRDAPDYSRRIMAVDPAGGKDSKQGDDSAVVEMGIAGKLRYVEAHGGRMNIERLCDLIVERVRAFRPNEMHFEVQTFQGLIQYPLRERAKAAGVELPPIREISNTENKTFRLRRLGEALVKRTDRFRAGSPATNKMVGQLKDFPTSRFDDMCFVAGTAIETADGPRPIESVRVGDMVLTRGGFRRVRAAGLTGTRAVVSVELAGGAKIVGTPDHPVWSDGRFVPMATASTMWTWEPESPPSSAATGLRPLAVLSVRLLEPAPVYNLSVDGEAEYFAGGVLVHNCDAYEMCDRAARESADVAFGGMGAQAKNWTNWNR